MKNHAQPITHQIQYEVLQHIWENCVSQGNSLHYNVLPDELSGLRNSLSAEKALISFPE